MTKVIIDYKDVEVFSTSTCECEFCIGMHISIQEWNTFEPETNLQQTMMDVVKKIETRERTKKLKFRKKRTNLKRKLKNRL